MTNDNQYTFSGSKSSTWRCPECETINTGARCDVCGQPRVIPGPDPNQDSSFNSNSNSNSNSNPNYRTCTCGNRNNPNAQFCSACGRKLDGKNKKKTIIAVVAAAVVALILFSGHEEPHTHSWQAATCTNPKTCTTCGETSGTTLSHSWKDATCTNPKTCKVCGITSGSAAGHKWKDATCTQPKTCEVCGSTSGSAKGHDWKDATSTAPMTCRVCGDTIGEPLEPTTPKGYIAYATGTWKKVTLDSANVHALVFDDKLVECREMTVVMEVEMKKGAKCKNWQLWGRVNGKFKKIGRIELPGGDGDTSKTFIFDDPITIDAVALTPTVSGGYSWSMALGVVDIWTNG